MWIKNGDFKRKDDPKSPLNRYKIYQSNVDSGRAITAVALCGYKNGDIIIRIGFTEMDYNVFKNAYSVILANMQSFLPVTTDNIIRSWKISSQDSNQLGIFLKLLLPIQPDIQLILADIYKTLKIAPSLGVLFDELKHQEPVFAMQCAAEAQDHLDYDLIWNLANFYLDDREQKGVDALVTIQQLFDFYNAILEKNPHYSAAQTRMFDLLCSLSPQNEEERIDLLEKKLVCLIGTSDNRLTDNIYHELCGYPYTGSPFISHVRGDPDTLISLARTIRTLNIMNQDKIQVSQTQVGFFQNTPTEQFNKTMDKSDPQLK